MRPRAFLRGQAAATALAVVAAIFCGAASAEPIAARHRPADANQVVLVLPSGMPRLAATVADDPDAVAAEAEAFLGLARATRDTRYYGRAEALVAPWAGRADAPPRLLVAAADLAQQRHDFIAARALLDRAIDRDARDPNARIRRANVALLLGEPAAARRDCLAALQAGASLPGTICLASALTGPGSAARGQRLLAPLESAVSDSPDIAAWLLTTGADLALRDGNLAAAGAQLARAATFAPDSDEIRARLAAQRLAAGDAAGALAAAQHANPTASLLVMRIRAARAAGDAVQAAAARRDLDALLEVGRLRGATLHLREEGELALYVDRDAKRALDLARRNFERQKDTPDLRLFVDAAIAGGDRDALKELRAWLAATGFEDRVAASRIARAGA